MLGLEDLLVVAEAVLEIDARMLRRRINTNLAESALAAPFAGFGDKRLFEDPVHRAAVLASRIVRNHPLPEGNKRVALILMDLYLEDQGYRIEATPAEIDRTLRELAGGRLDEDAFIVWVLGHVQKIAS